MSARLKMSARKISSLFVFVWFFGLVSCKFEILILHTNDMHARFDETDVDSYLIPANSKNDEPTFGGFARLKTAIDEGRAEAQRRNISSLFLNAGDTFQGTPFYTLLKEEVVSDLLPLLEVDAMSLGNHEFDDGTKVLAKHLEKAKIPVVAANLDFQYEPELQASAYLSKSLIIERRINGIKIGIIGYLTPETKTISSTEKTIFKDEVESVRAEVEIMKRNGVDVIIALGHSGIDVDKKVAREVDGVSLVIGGHTNTFLYNPPDKKPSTEIPEGDYPTIIEQPSGKKVPVVTAYAYTKYLGKLWITFNDDGSFLSVRPESNAMLIDSTIAKDKKVQDRVSFWRNKIDSKLHQVLGRTSVYLDGWPAFCKILECSLGNLITDSWIDYVAEKYNGSTGWTDAPIAICTSGSMRVSRDPKKVHGNITYEEVLTLLPYRTIIYKLELKGSILRQALEHAVAKYNGKYEKEVPNEFLQVSGIHMVYDMSKPPHKRIERVEVRCGNCTVPKYAPLDDRETYGVIVPKFIAEGGDEFSMLTSDEITKEIVPGDDGDTALTDTDALARYIVKERVVYLEVSGRIKVLNPPSGSPSSAISLSLFKSTWRYLTLSILTFVFLIHC